MGQSLIHPNTTSTAHTLTGNLYHLYNSQCYLVFFLFACFAEHTLGHHTLPDEPPHPLNSCNRIRWYNTLPAAQRSQNPFMKTARVFSTFLKSNTGSAHCIHKCNLTCVWIQIDAKKCLQVSAWAQMLGAALNGPKVLGPNPEHTVSGQWVMMGWRYTKR